MTEDKRRFTRIPFKVHAELEVEGRVFTTEEISNLSVGGCLLEIRDDIDVGTECKITIYIDGKRKGLRINASGEITRNDVDTVAIQFSKMSPDSNYYLTNIVKYSLPFIRYNPEFRIKIL